MRILLNGNYRGGNCPPFYRHFKNLGHEIKVYDALYYENKYEIEYGLFDSNDLIVPDFPHYFKYFYILYQKIRRTFLLKPFISSMKKVIDDFKPELIINHRASLEALISIKTNYNPQFVLIYGSEIAGKRMYSSVVKDVLYNVEKIITTVLEKKNRITAAYPDLGTKVMVMSFGIFHQDLIAQKLKSSDKHMIRQKWNIPQDCFLILDMRSLRSKEISLKISEDIKNIRLKYPTIHIILVKGYLGNTSVVKELLQAIELYHLGQNITIIDRIISFEEKIELFIASDAITSLLPEDSFGEVIMEGGLTQNLLILSNLEQYKKVFGDNAIYLSYQDDETLLHALDKYFNDPSQFDLKKVVEIIKENFDSEEQFNRLNKTIESYKS